MIKDVAKAFIIIVMVTLMWENGRKIGKTESTM